MISNKDIYENKKEGGTSQDNIRVGLLVLDPFVTETTIEGPDGKPKKIYGGIIYDVWTVIKKMNNWTGRVTEIPLELNFTKSVDDLANGKYDLVVGNFWAFKERVAKVLMPRTVFMSRIVAVFKPTTTHIQTISKLLFTYFIIPFTIIIILGIIFGYGLYLLEPKRGFMRSTRTATATFFGEAGYLFENSTLNIKAFFYIYIVMAIAYFFNIVLQGFVTTDIMQEAEQQEITMENISQLKPFITTKALDIGEIIAKYDIKTERLDLEHSEIASFYLRNTDKYSGFMTDYDDAKNVIDKHPELVITEDNFGFKENSFVISRNRRDLLEKINSSIVAMHNKDTIGNICKKYMTVEDSLYCTL